MSDKQLISIICPVHNEQDNVEWFYSRLQNVLEPLRDRYDFELIFTNNRSSDETLSIIRRLHEQDYSTQVITLSRNFGYQASLTAGLQHARGVAMMIIDVDCEDPPEMLTDFITEWQNGYSIVYGIREKRPEIFFVQWARKLFYRILKYAGDSDVILDMAEFSFFTAQIRDLIVKNASTFPFIRTEIAYVGFNRKGILYSREKRRHGKTHYNFISMFNFAVAGILSSSTLPLRLAAYSGAFLLVINLFLLVLDMFDIFGKAFNLLVTIDLMYMIIFVGVLSVYTARIYKDNVGRPLYIIDWQESILNASSETEKSSIPNDINQ